VKEGNAALLKTIPVVQGSTGSAGFLLQCWFTCSVLLTNVSVLAIYSLIDDHATLAFGVFINLTYSILACNHMQESPNNTSHFNFVQTIVMN